MKKQKKDPLYKSFGYAFAGIFAVVTKERNMKIHCVAMVCVVIAGFVFHITPVEWCICLTLFGLVMALEMVNTAVEAVVDLVTEERKPLAKLAKDAAAGAVLIAAIMAAIAVILPMYRYRPLPHLFSEKLLPDKPHRLLQTTLHDISVEVFLPLPFSLLTGYPMD